MALGSMPFSYLNIVSNSQMSLATSNLATSPSPEHAQVVRQNHFFFRRKVSLKTHQNTLSNEPDASWKFKVE